MATLIAFVVSLNLKRRHLNSGQRAVVALSIEKVLAEEASKNIGGRPRKNAADEEPFEIFQKVSEPIHAAKQAAAIVGTNQHYVNDAKTIAQRAPDLIDEILNGGMTLPEAKREIKAREKEHARQERATTPRPRTAGHNSGSPAPGRARRRARFW